MLTIGKLARRLELNPRTIRFYEAAGVLPEPDRTESGYRLYSPEDEERLRFVKSAQRLGLTLGNRGSGTGSEAADDRGAARGGLAAASPDGEVGRLGSVSPVAV